MVIFGLYLLADVLPPTIGGHKLRTVDLLADVKAEEDDFYEEYENYADDDEEEEEEEVKKEAKETEEKEEKKNGILLALSAEWLADADTGTIKKTPILLPLPPRPTTATTNTCPEGMTCIIDFADSTSRGMEPYYRAIERMKQDGGGVRVAFFGDSFIEADIMTADLREMLQKEYGGCGVGFVDIGSKFNNFRPTVVHNFGGWQSRATTDSTGFNRSKQGIAMRYFLPSAGAYVEYKGQRKYASQLDSFQLASIYFNTQGKVSLTAQINGGSERSEVFMGSDRLQRMQVKGNIASVRWQVKSAESAVFFGATLDGKNGIAVDNLAMRSSSGISLQTIPLATLKEFNRLRPYDLIILQYGLNVATERGRNYDHYKLRMQKTLKHLKEAFPQAGILLVSVGDRNYKTESGNLRTMPGVKNLIKYQETIAAESGVAFWNMFEAMGGEGSMVKLVQAQPPMANYDYTHINFRGGKYLAGFMFEALKHGKDEFDRRQMYENK